MKSNETKLKLDDAAKRALGQVYALLIRLADEEKTADGDSLHSEPPSAVSTSDEHRCEADDSTPLPAEQLGGSIG